MLQDHRRTGKRIALLFSLHFELGTCSGVLRCFVAKSNVGNSQFGIEWAWNADWGGGGLCDMCASLHSCGSVGIRLVFIRLSHLCR